MPDSAALHPDNTSTLAKGKVISDLFLIPLVAQTSTSFCSLDDDNAGSKPASRRVLGTSRSPSLDCERLNYCF